MNTVWQDILAGLRAASPLDQANLVLGFSGVLLMIWRSLWAFPVGLVAVSVQGVLFYRSRYYADATLQMFFFAVLLYGWWHWVKDRGAAPELPVTRMTPRGLGLTLGLAAAGAAIWAVLLGRFTDALMPWRDATIAAFSVTGQVLQARKQIENWPVWIAVNLLAVTTYWAGALYFTALLYSVYLGLALAGWLAWRRARSAQSS